MKMIFALLVVLFATPSFACVGGGEGVKCMVTEPAPIAKQLGTKKLELAKIIITKKEASKNEKTNLGSDVHDNVLSGGIA